MNPVALQMMKLRLAPIVSQVQAKMPVGDAFNLDNLAKLFVQVESINTMTPQLTQAMDYAKYIPVKDNFPAVVGSSAGLERKQAVGKGKAFAGTGMDIPLAEVTYDRVSLETKMGAVGYQYSIAEIATALALGITLEADKIAAAQLAFERHMSDVAWWGEAETGLTGFYNQTGVAVNAKTIDFATATPADVLDFVNTVIFDAQDVAEEDPAITTTTVIFPTNVTRTLAGRTIGANDTPLLHYIRENNEAALQNQTVEITANKRGIGEGTAGSDRIVSYVKDPNCLEMRIPQELKFEPAQPTGLDVFVPGSYTYQGLWLKRVDSMRYYDVAK